MLFTFMKFKSAKRGYAGGRIQVIKKWKKRIVFFAR